MKRGFLFGVGTFLGFAGLTGLSVDRPILESVLLAGIGVPLCLVTLSAASRAPPNRSRLHAVVGWLFGFFVIDAVALAVVGVILLLSPPGELIVSWP